MRSLVTTVLFALTAAAVLVSCLIVSRYQGEPFDEYTATEGQDHGIG